MVPIPSFREALWVWIKIGLLSFGGPAGQIALMQRELVDTRRWISHQRFLRALNYCMLLPGPEAHQLAIYTGWLLHGYRGGVIAGALFVLPGAALLLGISFVYANFGNTPAIASISWGLRASVIAIVAWAVIRLGRKVLTHWLLRCIAITSFVLIYFLKFPFAGIILGSLAIGTLISYFSPSLQLASSGHAAGEKAKEDETSYAISDTHDNPHIGQPSTGRLLKNVALWGTLWLMPTLLCIVMLGTDNYFSKAGLFFSQAALLTFGGAYSVLPFVAEHAVMTHHWLSAAEMMDGLGLAETTPGPLILVLQFVGFQGGWHATSDLPPWLNATLGAAITTWTTFMPGYLFIFCGAPYFERAKDVKVINRSLSMVTASVVGVILNLAVWFTWQTVFPAGGRIEVIPLVIAALFLWLIVARKCDATLIVVLGIVTGLIHWLAFSA